MLVGMTVSSMRRLKHRILCVGSCIVDSRNDRKLDEEIETRTADNRNQHHACDSRNDRKLDEEIETFVNYTERFTIY